MNCITRSAAAMAAGLAAACTAQVTVDWSTVGNAGNAADPLTGFGAVGYDYRIGTYEVTNAQYAAFLNSVAASDPNGLYIGLMGTDARGGITRSGSDGSYTYAARPDMGNKPANFVDWFDAARMANWITNGQPVGAQGAGTTETGVYTLTARYTITSINRDFSNADQVFLPTENEWYKAAYHQPAAQGGDADGYWLYATQSNSIPIVAAATIVGDIANPGPGVVNYMNGADWNGQDGHLTTVGSAGNTSFYGAFDMNGNVIEWNETPIGTQRGFRGGAFTFDETLMQSTFRGNFNPNNSFNFRGGIRFASPVPAPTASAVLALGGLAAARRRR